VRYLVLGVVDGLITAGTLSATLIFRGGGIGLDLLAPLAVVVASINALTVFVAEFVQQMQEVREAAYKVSLREEWLRWSLLHTRALYATAKSSAFAFASSLAGALAVLAPAAVFPPAAPLALALAVLAVGAFLAESWGDFAWVVGMIAFAVAVGIAVGLAFPVIA